MATRWTKSCLREMARISWLSAQRYHSFRVPAMAPGTVPLINAGRPAVPHRARARPGAVESGFDGTSLLPLALPSQPLFRLAVSRPYLLSPFIAIHPREVDVHQDNFRRKQAETGECLDGVGGNRHFMPIHFQHGLQTFSGVGMVFHDEDGAVFGAAPDLLPWMRRWPTPVHGLMARPQAPGAVAGRRNCPCPGLRLGDGQASLLLASQMLRQLKIPTPSTDVRLVSLLPPDGAGYSCVSSSSRRPCPSSVMSRSTGAHAFGDHDAHPRSAFLGDLQQDAQQLFMRSGSASARTGLPLTSRRSSRRREGSKRFGVSAFDATHEGQQC